MENKTDLSRILSISGQAGLFEYVAQSRNGVIVESLSDKRRMAFDMKTKISSLSDISIYTDDEELRLKDLFLKMKDFLGGKEAPSSKSDSKEIKAFFEKVVENYDRDRFYVSHMKKVLDWYNDLLKNASLDFEDDEIPSNKEEEVKED